MSISYIDSATDKVLVANLAVDISPEDAADAMNLAPGAWREITDEEAAELQQPTLEEALEILRRRKWQAKNAGITVNGIAIDTDDRGQATINGAMTNVLRNPAYTAQWKTAAIDETGASVWIVLDAAMISVLSDAMTRYVEACFNVEAMKQTELAALPEGEAIQNWLVTQLDAGWPGRDITIGGA